MLSALQSSVIVTTIQADRLIILRVRDGALNMHVRRVQHPMGLAVDNGRLALGVYNRVERYYDMPAVGDRVATPGESLDAVFMPRTIHLTGHIDSHDLGWGKEELWVVSSRFSALCTLDGEHSFVPRWRPEFVTALRPEDRCHLNGLAMLDGVPRYVTALGRSDTPEGWREGRSSGGLLIDVESGHTVAAGLNMPHSPRWHDGALWFLESGTGSLCRLADEEGRVDRVARLPGYVRGLDFIGDHALVGISRPRRSATGWEQASPEIAGHRHCGVWIVHLPSGQIAGQLEFPSPIDEIFALCGLSGVRNPDVVPVGDPVTESAWAVP